jgi:hypothetical protein
MTGLLILLGVVLLGLVLCLALVALLAWAGGGA